MLTRLQVKGFKNLVDVDVRFGPFTCIAGGNGVGKSNLFDAILFLGDLTEKSLLEAATGVRGESRGADALRVFSRFPDGGAIEQLPDAKARRHEALKVASELAGRRLKSFAADQRVHDLVSNILDFSPLCELPAFQALESDVAAFLRDRAVKSPRAAD